MSESDAACPTQLGLLVAELERLERRLRGFSPAAWRSRTELVRAALVDLIALEASVRGGSPHDLPHIADYALADALLVIGGDVIEVFAGDGSDPRLVDALSTVREALAATR